ncbi:hypothetical protein MTO96_005632 [Rhipicephalus appendiculatus]
MPKTKKSELLVVLVLTGRVLAQIIIHSFQPSSPAHLLIKCEPEPTPNCSLVFPSILFLNPCQYVCFERLLLPSITVRKTQRRNAVHARLRLLGHRNLPQRHLRPARVSWPHDGAARDSSSFQGARSCPET